MKKLPFLICVSFLTLLPTLKANTVTNAMVKRFYYVSPGVMRDEIAVKSEPEIAQSKSQVQINQHVRKLFEDAGLPFPEGSEITYDELTNTITMLNTVENHAVFKLILVGGDCRTPFQVEVEVNLVRICDQSLARQIVTNSLADLSDRRITLLDKISGVTISGNQTQVTNWRSLSGLTPKGKVANEKPPKPTGENAEESPTGRQTANSPDNHGDKFGSELNMTPSLGPDGYTINLTVIWEYRRFNGWVSIPEGRSVRFVPDITERSLMTSLVIFDEESVILQSHELPQYVGPGKPAKAGLCSEFVVLKARLLGFDGVPIRKRGEAPKYE